MTDSAAEGRPAPATGPAPGATDAANRAAILRGEMLAKLRADGKVTTPLVEAAVSAVAREHFLPAGTPLEIAYGVDDSVVTKRDEHGVAMSSVSAAYIQARMLEQAQLQPGQAVLEIGSGGLNAAMIAEIVGDKGRVVSVDIDPEVVDRATRLLGEAGYGDRVRVLATDADAALPGDDRFDAIIVTVGAWDVAPSWLDRLTPEGTLVLPLIMNGVTRTIGLRRAGDHLVSTSLEVAGFVPMQGAGRHSEKVFLLPAGDGHQVKLRFDSGAPQDMGLLDNVLASGRTEVWSGVTIENGVSFADLHLWLAWYLPGFCLLAADDGTAIAAERGRWFPFGVVRGRAFAYLAIRPVLEGGGFEFGARAYGTDGELAATALTQQICAWDRHGRRTEPRFGYWPAGSDRSSIPADAAVMDKTHGTVTISWPAHR